MDSWTISERGNSAIKLPSIKPISDQTNFDEPLIQQSKQSYQPNQEKIKDIVKM